MRQLSLLDSENVVTFQTNEEICIGDLNFTLEPLLKTASEQLNRIWGYGSADQREFEAKDCLIGCRRDTPSRNSRIFNARFPWMSQKATGGISLERQMNVVLQMSGITIFGLKEKADRKSKLGQWFGTRTNKDIDIIGENPKIAFVTQMRASTNAGGATAKGSLVPLLLQLTNESTRYPSKKFHFIIFDVVANQKASWLKSTLYNAVVDSFANGMSKEGFSEKVQSGGVFHEGIHLHFCKNADDFLRLVSEITGVPYIHLSRQYTIVSDAVEKSFSDFKSILFDSFSFSNLSQMTKRICSVVRDLIEDEYPNALFETESEIVETASQIKDRLSMQEILCEKLEGVDFNRLEGMLMLLGCWKRAKQNGKLYLPRVLAQREN